jgi:uncharacterized membrane protein (UPF0127 family)
MSINIVVYKREHDVKHYVGLSFQAALMYIVFIGGVFSIPAAQLIAEKITEMNVQRAVIGETAISLDIADTEPTRIQGLSGRKSMPKNHAMLFVFDEISQHGIWMKDMNFALDIVWLNEYSEVIHIERNVTPETFPKTFGPQKQSKYVLEFNAGFTSRNGIKVGDKFVQL